MLVAVSLIVVSLRTISGLSLVFWPLLVTAQVCVQSKSVKIKIQMGYDENCRDGFSILWLILIFGEIKSSLLRLIFSDILKIMYRNPKRAGNSSDPK